MLGTIAVESPQELLDRVSIAACNEIWGGSGWYTEDDMATVAKAIKPIVAKSVNRNVSDFPWPNDENVLA
jgi:hypothetical protein